MNPWIIVGIIGWLGCGFVGRCMMKYAFVKRWQPFFKSLAPLGIYRKAWPKRLEVAGGLLALSGLLGLLGSFIFILSRKEMRLGLML